MTIYKSESCHPVIQFWGEGQDKGKERFRGFLFSSTAPAVGCGYQMPTLPSQGTGCKATAVRTQSSSVTMPLAIRSDNRSILSTPPLPPADYPSTVGTVGLTSNRLGVNRRLSTANHRINRQLPSIRCYPLTPPPPRAAAVARLPVRVAARPEVTRSGTDPHCTAHARPAAPREGGRGSLSGKPPYGSFPRLSRRRQWLHPSDLTDPERQPRATRPGSGSG